MNEFVFDVSSAGMLTMALCILIAAAVIGQLTDAVMGDRGFGAIGNGVLMVLGAGVGLFARSAFLGTMARNDATLTLMIAGLSSVMLLLALGVAKHWIRD